VIARPDVSDRVRGTPHTLTDWLRRRSDDELIELLRRRPDLALPAPADVAALASRVSVRSSISRALDSLDAFTLRVLEIIVDLGPETSVEAVRTWFDAAEHGAVTQAIAVLQDWVLVWNDDVRVHPVGALSEVLGPYPAGLGRPAAELYAIISDIALAPLLRRLGLPPATQPASGNSAASGIVGRIDQLLAESPPAERAILDRLADGPPIGALRNAGVEADATNPARSLVARGLLVPVDRDTVELPREIALRLRPHPAGSVRPEPNPIATVHRGAEVIDGGGASRVLDTVRLIEVLLNAIADDPPVPLRSGGLGVRELRRLARILDVAESVAALLVEITFEAGLLSCSSTVDAAYLPTTEYDSWLRRPTAARWVQVSAAWLTMTRLPSLIGDRDDRDKTIAALSTDVERHSAPALRLQLLHLLEQLPAGHAPTSQDDVLNRLAWGAPRRASAGRAVAAAILEEAALLGVTGYGAIPDYARPLVDGAETGSARADVNATEALVAALPAEVEEFLVQPDLTVVVPGPPASELRRELALAADLESTGGASVYRLGPTSLRRALDAGRTGSDLLQFFTARSRTPLPQALRYLINDVATQHGRLRAGSGTSYLRCDDASLLDRVMAEPTLESLGLQRIAPTVLVCTSGISTILERLRTAGFSPAAESADGAIVTYAADSPRVAARPHSRVARVRRHDIGEAQVREVVGRLRASEKLAAAVSQSAIRVSQQIPGVTSASILELLRQAIRNEQTIALGYVDDTGRPSQRTLMPISLGGGMIRGHIPDDHRLHSYPLQRITTVSVLGG